MRALPVVLFGLIAAGCHSDHLWVTQMRVLDEDDGAFGGRLDIEVHLFDAASGKHLGCSDVEFVDSSGVTFDDLDAGFVGSQVDPSDLFGRQVRIDVIEDDSDPCPAPPHLASGDDPVGTSGPIDGDALGQTGPLSFGNVASITLEVY